MAAIYKRELKAYFDSMIGYIFIGFFVLITAVYFSVFNLFSLSPDFRIALGNVVALFLILVPALTMRLLAEESKQKTDQLLLTAPVKVTDIVLGKYFAAITVFLIGLLFTALFPFMISLYGKVSFLETFGTYIGFFFMGSSFIAIGLWVSAMTDNQIIAAIGSFAVLFLFLMIDYIAIGLPSSSSFSVSFMAMLAALIIFYIFESTRNVKLTIFLGILAAFGIIYTFILYTNIYTGLPGKILTALAIIVRYENFSLGIMDFGALIYFVSFSAAFLYLTIGIIEKRRWS
ncbi:MAG: ABC-2 transporter permease [Lachnospiraceae bacterium]|nr:ABC-2 transporter permease [Lachnospiraceae bacterium]